MSVLLYDNFTGTTIDTSKWTETDPNSRISQNNVLSISNPASSTITEFTDKLQSVSSVSSGVSVAQGLINFSSGGSNEPLGGIYLWKDNSNFAYIGSRSSGGTYRLRIYSGGTQVYTYESNISVNKDVKIVSTGSQISFYYWSGSAWTQIGTTQTVSLGYNIYYVISHYDFKTTTGANPVNIDDAYFSDADYTTQYPPTTAIKSINGLAYASIKSYNGLAMSSVKSVNGLA